MLAAAQRLRRRVDFTEAVRAGRRAGRGSLVVHLVIGSEPVCAEQSVRAGFVVSKAVGGAVVRNLVRRRLRHLVRDRLDGLPPGSTLVVRAQPAAAERGYAGLGEDLDAAIAAALRPRGRGSKPRGRGPGGDR